MRGSPISSSGTNTLVSTAAFDVPDDILFTLGTTSDIALVLNTAGLSANEELTGAIVGTSVHPATAVNSLLISNITTDSDIQILASDGGNSNAFIHIDSSTPDLYLYNVGGTWTAGATTWTIPAVTLGGAVAGGDQAFTGVGDMTFTAGSILASGSTNGNTLLIRSNDTTFITLTTGATDACTLAGVTLSGTILASGTVTMPALTLGGNIAGGGKVISALDRSLYNETNLLNNGNFETGSPPSGWTATNSTLSRETTPTPVYGTYCLKVTRAAADSLAFQSIADYARYKGKNVTLRVRSWLPAANTSTSIYILITDGVGNSYVNIASDTDDTWTEHTVTRAVSASASELTVKLYSNEGAGTGTREVYYDGVILVEGDSCPSFSPKPDQRLINHGAASQTLSAYETGHVVHTNLGMGAQITYTLPQTVSAGQVYRFAVMTAQELRIDPGAAGAIYINGAKQTDDKYITADDEAESVDLVADGNGDWIARNVVGTWGVEA